MYFITIVYINMYTCNVLMNVRTMFSFSYCLNGYIFSGVPPLKQFFKFTLDAVTLPVENTTLMVALLSLQLTSESHFTAVRKCEY